jgi:RNA polymerase sigma factor for flagellar operon FliA
MLLTVRRVATQMARRLPGHVDVEDLVGAGALGLADAFSRRNGMPGSEFEAFASYRVRGAILDELRRLDTMPRRTRARAKQVAKARRTVEQRQGGAASAEEMASEMGLDVPAYQALQGMLEASRGPIYFQAVANDDEDGVHNLADARAELPEAIVARMELGELVLQGIHALSERMKSVLVGLYVDGHTLKEIGVSMRVSESRVCQIHSEALAILRKALVGDDAPPAPSCIRLRRAAVAAAEDRRGSSRAKAG